MSMICKILFVASILAGCTYGMLAADAPSPTPQTPRETRPSQLPQASEAGTATVEDVGGASGKHAPVFNIQLWDAHKTGWTDERLSDVAAAGFTVVQHGWNGSFLPSRGLLDRVKRHGLSYGAYIDTRQLFRRFASSEERKQVHLAVGYDARSGRELNTFCPVYQAVVRREIEKGLRRLEGTPGLYKILLNSEHSAPLSYDALTVARAVDAGVMRPTQQIPRYHRGVFRPPAGGATANLADPVRFLRWFDSEGGDAVINRVAADAAREARPGLLAATDPLSDHFTYGQYRGMDILQDWVRVHGAPRDPLSVAYRVERLKAHLRHEGKGQIWIGPQLGSSTKQGTTYAAPADEFEEALWLAVAFGARGITCWGYNTIRPDNPLDRDTWGRIRKFRDRLLAEFPFILEAEDAPRSAAVLLSKANQVLSSRAYYEVPENYENFYRVLLTAHIPTDVLYDDDVLEGSLARYQVLFLPGIEKVTPDIEAAIGKFEKQGGRVVRWEFLRPRYKDYEITRGNTSETLDVDHPGGKYLLPHQYRAWRRLQAARLFETVADLMDIRLDNPDVIMNVVEVRGKRYAVLINDRRTYGAWTKERGHRWSEDKGEEASLKLAATGREEAAITIPPAGIAVIPL